MKSIGLKEIGMIFYTLREDDSEQYAKARDVKYVINGCGRDHKGGDPLVQSVAGVREGQQWGHHHGRGHRRQGKPGNQRGMGVSYLLNVNLRVYYMYFLDLHTNRILIDFTQFSLPRRSRLFSP